MIKLILINICLLSCRVIYGQAIEPSEYIINSTIKIESIEQKIVDGKIKNYECSGTGFFFEFNTNKGYVPVIVTNKHVVLNSKTGRLCLKLSDSSGNPDYNATEILRFSDFKNAWFFHPDSTVDLAIMPLQPIFNEFVKKGKRVFFTPYREENIPNDSILNTLTAIEDVLMIGYPFGLGDLKNNLPVVRKGITATPAILNYNSRQEFLLDIPVYFGSSGSPVIIYNNAFYSTRQGGKYMGGRVLFLGINYATYTKNFKGKIVPISSQEVGDSTIVQTPIPYNIGIIIKAQRLLEFKPIILAKNNIKLNFSF